MSSPIKSPLWSRDTDHIGDLEVVADNFAIGEILVSPGSMTDVEFVTRLRKLQVPVQVVKSGDKLLPLYW